MDKLKVGIVGCGKIGALKDKKFDGVGKKPYLTHASVVYHHPNFEISWMVDKNEYVLGQAMDKWGVKKVGYDDADIIVVSCDTEKHMDVIRYVCGFENENRVYDPDSYGFKQPKVIILEKPAGNDIYETTGIDFMAKEAGIKIFVNYNRSYCEEIVSVLEEIRLERIINSITCHYSGSLKYNGCHMINVVNNMAGFLKDCIVDNDVLILKYSNCPNVQLIRSLEDYIVFEMVVYTNHGRYEFLDSFRKINFYGITKETKYGGWNRISQNKKKSIKVPLENSLQTLYDSVFYFFSSVPENGKFYCCDSRQALKVNNVLNQIDFKKLLNGANGGS